MTQANDSNVNNLTIFEKSFSFIDRWVSRGLVLLFFFFTAYASFVAIKESSAFLMWVIVCVTIFGIYSLLRSVADISWKFTFALVLSLAAIMPHLYLPSNEKVSVIGKETTLDGYKWRNPLKNLSAVVVDKSFGVNKFSVTSTTKDGVVVTATFVWNYFVVGDSDTYIAIVERYPGKKPNDEIKNRIAESVEKAISSSINSKNHYEMDIVELATLAGSVITNLDLPLRGSTLGVALDYRKVK